MPKRWMCANRTAFFCVALVVLGFFSLSAWAQVPGLNGVAHAAIRVKDLAAARSFYQKLGFDEAFTLSKDGVVNESFIKINDRQFIELYPVTEKNTEVGFLHLCFEGADLDAINRDYVSRGLTPKTVKKAGAGNLLFTMEGPEGQNIEYTQYMPGSLHSNDRGNHLGTNRIADQMVTVSLAMKDMDAARTYYLEKLKFTASPKNPMLLDLPGGSGQHVEIVSSELGQRSRIALETSDLRKAAASLKAEQIPATKSKDGLTVTDPDGNIILIQAR